MSFFSVTPRNVSKVVALLNKCKYGQKGFVAKAVAEYILGDSGHGLRHYAPWKRVTRKSAYGKTFFSDKQRAAFFAGLRDGNISVPYHRTGKQGAAWHLEGRSTTVRIVNKDPSTKWTRGQTSLHAKMGWMTTVETVKSNMAGALRKGEAALKQWLKGLR